MQLDLPSVRSLRESLDSANRSEVRLLVTQSVEQALALSNRNAGRNTYLWQNAAWTYSEVDRILRDPVALNLRSLPLWGLPVSVKDCFDLAGARTSCGTKFYRDLNGEATHDSWLVEQLRTAGAIITGKTHLHPLAYGITGENPDFGDSRQPANDDALTGGSSSGAAASILEGSAVAAIGTDTGGSIRVPAALCGIAGYRSSLGRGNWQGAGHLAPSFDTLGWLYRDLEDGPLLGTLFEPSSAAIPTSFNTFAVVNDQFLTDCEPNVLSSYRLCQQELQALGLTPTTVDVSWWADSTEIFAPIQASEAALIHQGNFAHFEASIRQRLEWGASLDQQTVASLRARHRAFRDQMDLLLAQHPLLLLPAAPVARLEAGADHSQTRARLLRYTSPISLAGMPAVTIPFSLEGRPAGGMQLIAARENDAALLALSAKVGKARKLMLTQRDNMVVS